MEDGHITNERSETASLSPWWRHSAILVMIVGFTILSIVTVKTYDNAPPIPARVVDDAGGTVFTRDDVLRGQEVFFKSTSRDAERAQWPAAHLRWS